MTNHKYCLGLKPEQGRVYAAIRVRGFCSLRSQSGRYRFHPARNRTTVLKPTRFCGFRTPLAQRPLAQEKPCQFLPGARPPSSPTIVPALALACRATRRRKSPPKCPRAVIDPENSQQEFASGPRSLTDMGLECLLLGVKQTSIFGGWMSAFSQKRTLKACANARTRSVLWYEKPPRKRPNRTPGCRQILTNFSLRKSRLAQAVEEMSQVCVILERKEFRPTCLPGGKRSSPKPL